MYFLLSADEAADVVTDETATCHTMSMCVHV